MSLFSDLKLEPVGKVIEVRSVLDPGHSCFQEEAGELGSSG